MINTQANKLSAILKFGTIFTVTYKELLKETEKPGEYAKSSEVRRKEILVHKEADDTCWEYLPYKNNMFDFIKVRQFSKNPFTIVDLIFELL